MAKAKKDELAAAAAAAAAATADGPAASDVVDTTEESTYNLHELDRDASGAGIRPAGTPEDHKPFLVSMDSHDTRLVFAADPADARLAGMKKWGVWATPHPVSIVPYTGKLVDQPKPDDKQAQIAELEKKLSDLKSAA